MIHAWGDESGSNAAIDPGTYILGAVMGFESGIEQARTAMSALKLGAERKIHWQRDSPQRHMSVIGAIESVPVEGFVVVRCALNDTAERSRRKCLEAMLAHLEDCGCVQLTLESRGAKPDRRDGDLLESLRRKHHPGRAVRLYHEPGPKEPMLWIADALCGAVSQYRCGNKQYLDRISRTVDVRIIDP